MQAKTAPVRIPATGDIETGSSVRSLLISDVCAASADFPHGKHQTRCGQRETKCSCLLQLPATLRTSAPRMHIQGRARPGRGGQLSPLSTAVRRLLTDCCGARLLGALLQCYERGVQSRAEVAKCQAAHPHRGRAMQTRQRTTDHRNKPPTPAPRTPTAAPRAALDARQRRQRRALCAWASPMSLGVPAAELSFKGIVDTASAPARMSR
jgi:hypothetical protein